MALRFGHEFDKSAFGFAQTYTEFIFKFNRERCTLPRHAQERIAESALNVRARLIFESMCAQKFNEQHTNIFICMCQQIWSIFKHALRFIPRHGHGVFRSRRSLLRIKSW